MNKEKQLQLYQDFIINCTTNAKSVKNYSDFKRINECLELLLPQQQGISILDYDDPVEFKDVINKLTNQKQFVDYDTKGGNQYSNTLKHYLRFLYAKKMFLNVPAEKEKNEVNDLALQQIFYGAPGTGKSHRIKDDAGVKAADEKNLVFRTTFHPDSDYSTFVGCYKPLMDKKTSKIPQPILDYDSLVDKFKEYLMVPNVNITKACTLFGYDYHDSIIRIQENGHKVMDLVNDAYKSNTSYDSVVRGGMACYEQNPIKESDSKIIYSFVPQAFTNAYVKAWSTKEDVYLIIEEINRGNCAQIFGDLFQLLDRGGDGRSEYPINADCDLTNYIGKALAESTRDDFPDGVKDGRKLMLPENLYIWATMNTSDQSLFPIDSAFKRRWEWKYVRIAEGKKKDGEPLNYRIKFTIPAKDEELAELVDVPWWNFVKAINKQIEDATKSEDKKLGYFFCKPDKKANEADENNTIISAETFVGKVVFYLWQDVFKDYGFKSDIFKRANSNKISFHDFYPDNITPDEATNPEAIDFPLVKEFIDKVIAKNEEQ